MSTLSDIVQQLKENRQADEIENLDLINTVNTMSSDIVTAVSSTNKTIASALLKRERDKLAEREKEKEADKKPRGGARKTDSYSSDDSGSDSGNLLTGFLAGISASVVNFGRRLLDPIAKLFRILVKPLTFLKNTLRLIGSLIVRGGPIGAIITGLYFTFRDIAENETFQEAVTTIRDIWSNNIIPTFERIKTAIIGIGERVTEFITNFLASDGVVSAVNSMISYWNRFRDTVQDFAINGVLTLVETVSGMFEGLAMIFEGDFYNGFSKIFKSLNEGIVSMVDNIITSVTRLFNSLLKGIANAADAVITFVLGAFGVDFGEDGSFRTWLDDKIFGFVDNVKELWNTFFNAVKDRWNNSMTILSNTIANIGDGLEAIKDVITSTVSYYGTKIKNDLMIAFEAMKATVLNIPDQIRLAVMENLRFGMPTIELPMPRWAQALGAPENFTLLNGFEVGVGNQQQIEEVRGRINERNTDAIDAISGYRSETAAALEELNAARENFRSVMSQPIVVNNVDNSSRNSSNATVRYDTNLSPYNSDYFLRRNLAPDMLGR